MHRYLLDGFMNKDYFNVFAAVDVRNALLRGIRLDPLFVLENANCRICIARSPCLVLLLN